MERTVYLGPYNNSMSRELFNKAVEYLKENKGDKFYYLLPNGKLLVDYRKRILDVVNNAFDINLFTFDNIVDRLLKDKFYTKIDGETKEAVIASVLKDLKDRGQLIYYRDICEKKGFIKVVAGIIGEIKRSLVTPEEYMKRCPNSLFYKEIGYIYEKYEIKLKEYNLVDREESFMKSLELLKNDLSFFDGLDFIIIDYFFDFRPQELNLLKEIAKTNCSIYINMPFDRRENFKTFKKTLELLSSMDFTIKRVDEWKHDQFDELASILFDENRRAMDFNKSINVIKAANGYLEIKKIAEETKRHLSRGIELKEMAIVLTNSESYRDLLFQVFEEEGIPLALDKEISLIEIPLMKELIYIFEAKKYKMDKKRIINRVKSNYYPIADKKDREFVEYILRKGNIEDLYKYNMKYIIESIQDEINSIPSTGTIVEYVNLIINILKKYNVEETILNLYNTVRDYSFVNRDFSALNRFKEILNSISGILSNMKGVITLEEFIDIIIDYMQNESIVEIYGNIKGINILTPITARGYKYKVLFVIGMTQGIYPNIGHRDFFFKEDNYRELKQIGIDVKNYYEILDKEFLMFSNIISSCSNTLYLSYSVDSSEDEKAIESIMLDEVLNRIKGDNKEDKVNMLPVEIDYIFKDKVEDMTTKRELLGYILREYSHGNCHEELFNMYNDIDKDSLKEINIRLCCEINRELDGFNEYSGLITDEEVKKDLYNIHRNKIYSISYLETYGACPYKFLLNKVLRVDEMERESEEFTPLDLGYVKHEVLKEFYYSYKSKIEDYILNGKNFDFEEIYEFLKKKTKDKMKSISTVENSIEMNLIALNSANRLFEFIIKDLDRMKSYERKALPYDFEVPFGEKRTFEINVDGKKIPFTGIIDRIDKYVNEDKYIIIDYKNSSLGINTIEDIKKGISLQLPLYILSQENREVVAGIYGILSMGEFEETLVLKDEGENLKISSTKGILTKDELNAILENTKNNIKSFIESIHSGDFSVNPRKCDSYCIYKDICRIKRGLDIQ